MPILNEALSIISLEHPDFKRNSLFWTKFRITYEAGPIFVRTYLKKYSKREDDNEFRQRKSISYCPSFAKMAINEIRNAICQRMPDISREDGPQSYIEAAEGVNGGVDLQGSSMNLFMGDKVISELLSMSKVGVFVDMPSMIGPTAADKGGDRPYIYLYKAEQIRTWAYDTRQPNKLVSILLEDSNYVIDPKTGLTTGTEIVYRHLWINENNRISVQFYDTNGMPGTFQELNLNQIPFVVVEIPESLLLDVADYQIALLNLESSDLAYILKSNYPFYTEQFDVRSEGIYLKQPGVNHQEVFEDHHRDTAPNYDNVQEVETGTGAGRRYPTGTERPGFIHPSSEPLRISMEKGDQLKRDIRLLVHLAVANLGINNDKTPNNTLDAGLALIGLKIEGLERKIAELWALYEGDKPTTINYPETYSLITEEDRRKEASDLDTLTAKIPSLTYKKESKKLQAEITLGHKIPKVTLEKIKREIDGKEVVDSDPDIIKTDLENGLVSVELASKIRGYPLGQVEMAKKDHEERIMRIALAQSEGAAASRGVGDLASDPKGPAKEKQTSRDTTQDPIPTDKTRGNAQ